MARRAALKLIFWRFGNRSLHNREAGRSVRHREGADLGGSRPGEPRALDVFEKIALYGGLESETVPATTAQSRLLLPNCAREIASHGTRTWF